MKNQPLISVVVNNYNYARFLRDAIDSALAQTYPSVEVVVADDGSTDGSREVIGEYGNRVVPLLKENGGQASACNEGFAACRGDVVIFLDADDELLPDTAGRVAAAFRDNPKASKVQYRLRTMDASGEAGEGVTPPPGVGMPDGDVLPVVLKFFDCPRPPTSGNAFAASALRRILPLPEGDLELFRIGFDRYLNDLSVMFGPVVSLEGAGGLYRVHGGNLYASVRSVNLDFLARILRRQAYDRAAQKRLFREIYSIETQEVGKWDLFYLRDRMIHAKLDPANHPFKDDEPPSLFLRGCAAAAIYPNVSPPKRAAYALWFTAMLIAPVNLAETLAELTLYPENRKRLAGRLLGSIRRTGSSG